MTRDVLYVAARAPRPGFAKTRLGRTIGHTPAAALYAAFLRDLAGRFRSAPVEVGWYVTPPDAWPEIRRHIGSDWDGAPVLVQGAGDWTDRQRELFRGAAARRERRTVLIAADSPQLGVEVILEAFSRLNDADLVLGPVDDGGYYLIGMHGAPAPDAKPRRANPAAVSPWDVLDGVAMSTGTVLDQLLARAARLRLSVALVPPTFDVDEAADLERLVPLAARRADLAATRAELAALGLLTAGGLAPAAGGATLAAAGASP